MTNTLKHNATKNKIIFSFTSPGFSSVVAVDIVRLGSRRTRSRPDDDQPKRMPAAAAAHTVLVSSSAAGTITTSAGAVTRTLRIARACATIVVADGHGRFLAFSEHAAAAAPRALFVNRRGETARRDGGPPGDYTTFIYTRIIIYIIYTIYTAAV